MLTTEQDAAVSKAEIRIRKILLDLEEEAEVNIEGVNVDTRTFADLMVSISTREAAQP